MSREPLGQGAEKRKWKVVGARKLGFAMQAAVGVDFKSRRIRDPCREVEP
jgi:hypothetical protein